MDPISPELLAETLAKNIKRAIANSPMNQGEAAAAAGVSDATMSNYARGKRVPDAINLYRIARALGVSVGWLLGEDDDGLHPVPIMSGELGAGPGGTADGVAIIDHVGLPPYWLRNRLGIEPKQAFLAPVRGISMPGIFADGDLALGAYCRAIERPDIYAVYHERELLVKHVRRVHGEGDIVVRLISSHESYPPIDVHRHDDFRVIGVLRGRIGRINA